MIRSGSPLAQFSSTRPTDKLLCDESDEEVVEAKVPIARRHPILT